ncbi:glycosyl hydrolase family 8 [Clostridium tertium]|uniref:glycosyl hydrolase family 8 n=1 Tax=Clostridium TaxID=1485 RepID=UPI0018A8A0CE|nr:MULTISPECIES: glycosyl hydrolase family 8 [Clostridium]MBS5305720.1 glycosyl hydrolase [Clostridium sp.]MDB1922895.1 glycosyl hydrolase family 8 [Clostridium tertium]MDB1927787.1 glycosyl hydrolase family 8 [Clostridium tertium]MDB1929130.1 glycosyl hydrolase family 8 [Clostridium tertium]MDB1932669.1 glycosyl hydrolase family 8 [Clostridium tertium]
MKKTNKQIITIIVLLLFVISCIYLSYIYLFKYIKNIEINSVASMEEVTKEEEILNKFINEKLMDEYGGIYTNYNNISTEGDLTKGHDILSESQGMMLNYCLYKNDQEKFNDSFKYIKENMFLKNGLISWRIENNKSSDVSATIDDLRIARALIIGAEEFDNLKYRYYGIKISNGIYKNLIQENRLIDFHDGYGKSNVTTLCYLDLYALKLFSLFDDKWNDVYTKSLEIINNGYISDELPLYRKYYDGNIEIFDNEENIDTLLSILVILNKAEVNEDISKSVDWIKERLKYIGYISTSYNINTLDESKIESTSIYANIAQIAKVINDEELYNMAINKMKNFQVINEKSNIYGSFGNEKTEDVYSYDNLNALLAFRRGFNR